jgi:hypothetical protein
VTFWYDRRLSEDTWVRLQPFYGYAWLETDPFVSHGGGTVSLSHTFTTLRRIGVLPGELQRVPLHLRLDPGRQFVRYRNRDGLESESGVEGIFAVVPGSTSLRAGTAYSHYWAEGRDWDRNGLRTWVGATSSCRGASCSRCWDLLLPPLRAPLELRPETADGMSSVKAPRGPTTSTTSRPSSATHSPPGPRSRARAQYTSAESNVRGVRLRPLDRGGLPHLDLGPHTLEPEVDIVLKPNISYLCALAARSRSAPRARVWPPTSWAA